MESVVCVCLCMWCDSTYDCTRYVVHCEVVCEHSDVCMCECVACTTTWYVVCGVRGI